MKKVCLLSGMMAFFVTLSINASDVRTSPGNIKEKHRQKIEQVQWGKIERQQELARPAIYKMVDALITEEYVMGHYDENNQWIEEKPEWKIIVDWPAVFRVIDSMHGAIDVDEYSTPKNGNYLLWVAVEQGNFLAAKTLLEKYHADPNDYRCMGGHGKYEVCTNKLTLLRLAQQKKDFTMALLLRQHGANL